jgi:predicted ATP-grasp superfamily ATP-dependent carboligase
MIDENKKPDDASDRAFETSSRLMLMKISIDKLFAQVDEIASRLQKLELAYYQAFPDRADQDVRFENQLYELNSPNNPSNKPKS